MLCKRQGAQSPAVEMVWVNQGDSQCGIRHLNSKKRLGFCYGSFHLEICFIIAGTDLERLLLERLKNLPASFVNTIGNINVVGICL